MGTITKFLQQWHDKAKALEGVAPRMLPASLQLAVLSVIDQEVADAHAALEEEVSLHRREKLELAEENEHLAARIDGLVDEMAGLTTDWTVVEGLVAHLKEELAGARQETMRERERTEDRQTQLTAVRYRIETLSHLEREHVELRKDFETHREGRVRAEQEVAVLRAQMADIERRLKEMKDQVAAPIRGKSNRGTAKPPTPSGPSSTRERKGKSRKSATASV